MIFYKCQGKLHRRSEPPYKCLLTFWLSFKSQCELQVSKAVCIVKNMSNVLTVSLVAFSTSCSSLPAAFTLSASKKESDIHYLRNVVRTLTSWPRERSTISESRYLVINRIVNEIYVIGFYWSYFALFSPQRVAELSRACWLEVEWSARVRSPVWATSPKWIFERLDAKLPGVRHSLAEGTYLEQCATHT